VIGRSERPASRVPISFEPSYFRYKPPRCTAQSPHAPNLEAVGIEDPEVARTEGLCATTIQGPDLYHLRDASQDEVASKNPLVSPSDGIRFYAGHPLETRDGLNLGSFCVMGHEPRNLSDGDREYLTEIARLAIYEIERRYAQEEPQKLNVELDFRIQTRTKALDSVI